MSCKYGGYPTGVLHVHKGFLVRFFLTLVWRRLVSEISSKPSRFWDLSYLLSCEHRDLSFFFIILTLIRKRYKLFSSPRHDEYGKLKCDI